MSQLTCTAGGCTGSFEDGYCNVCGCAETAVAPQAAQGAAASSRTSYSKTHGGLASKKTSGTQLSGVTLTGAATGATRATRASRNSRGSASLRSLGLGLVDVPEVPRADPTKSLMAEAKVPPQKRICSGYLPSGSACGTVLDKREKGFCPNCRTQYNFQPGLETGELVAGQYEVQGAIAFGGMGWIYLARDVTLGRYVVLKGLVNQSDASLAAAAVAERQFLAEVKHANIVGVYTCVQHQNSRGSAAYTVMEYVGGRTLKSLCKERGALPVAEVLAYMHRVLAAFSYMHSIGLIYNDFKPDNVMFEDGDIKVIDLGGVTRASDTDGDIYSTVGYAAPELATRGPSPSSDLYTIGRTIAVLCTEFRGFQDVNQHTLFTPDQEPVFQRYDSFYRFLVKACHENPDLRYQSAEEMAEQLAGVLRDVVSIDTAGNVGGESNIFGPDTLVEREADALDLLDAASLPRLKPDLRDPAAAMILTGLTAIAGGASKGGRERQRALLEKVMEQYPDSHEAQLALAKNQIDLEQYAEAEATLKAVEAADGFDWRVIWYRGASFLARGMYVEAYQAFDTCYGEVPGEVAPKVAMALCAELAGNADEARALFGHIAQRDNNASTAVFGLARNLARAGMRKQAVDAYAMVPVTSSMYVDAQKAIARVLIDTSRARPEADDIALAARTMEALVLTGVEKLNMVQSIFAAALDYVMAAKKPLTLGDGQNQEELSEAAVRLKLESSYRDLARMTHDRDERYRLVDLANQVRPRSKW